MQVVVNLIIALFMESNYARELNYHSDVWKQGLNCSERLLDMRLCDTSFYFVTNFIADINQGNSDCTTSGCHLEALKWTEIRGA